METEPWNNKEHVGPVWMDAHLLFRNDTRTMFNTIRDEFERKYGIACAVRFTTGGHPEIGLSGPFRNVYHCIRTEWHDGDCSDEQERMLATLADMGDAEAFHRWNTGCRIGFVGHPKTTTEFAQKAVENAADDDEFDLHWERHWESAKQDGGWPGGRDRGTELAINMLASTGRKPAETNSDYDPVITAQSYLELAFAHVPELMDHLEGLYESPIQGTIQEQLQEEMMQAVRDYNLVYARKCLVALEALRVRV